MALNEIRVRLHCTEDWIKFIIEFPSNKLLSENSTLGYVLVLKKTIFLLWFTVLMLFSFLPERKFQTFYNINYNLMFLIRNCGGNSKNRHQTLLKVRGRS